MILLIILICMIPLYFLLFGKSNSLEINAKDYEHGNKQDFSKSWYPYESLWNAYCNMFYNAYVSDDDFVKKEDFINYCPNEVSHFNEARVEDTLIFQYEFMLSVKNNYGINYMSDTSGKYDFFKEKYLKVSSKCNNTRYYLRAYKDYDIEESIKNNKENFIRPCYWEDMFKNGHKELMNFKFDSKLEKESTNVKKLQDELDEGAYDYLLDEGYRFLRLYMTIVSKKDHKYSEKTEVLYDLKNKILLTGYDYSVKDDPKKINNSITYVNKLIDGIDKSKTDILAYVPREVDDFIIMIETLNSLKSLIKNHRGDPNEEKYVRALYKKFKDMQKDCGSDGGDESWITYVSIAYEKVRVEGKYKKER